MQFCILLCIIVLCHLMSCTRSEMDIITVFGTVVSGSNPDGCTLVFIRILSPIKTFILYSFGDNYVCIVYKGQNLNDVL